LATSIAADSPEYAKSGFTLSGDSLANSLVSTVRPTLVILFAVVALVLIIACANVANLQLIRAIDRSTEFAVRLALGASHGRLWRQILTESVVIGLCAACLAMFLTSAGISLLLYLDPAGIPRLQDLRVETSTVIVATFVAFAAAVLLGAIAARYGTSDSRLRHQPSGRGSSGRVRPVQRFLVISQVALSVVLLTGAGLLLRSVVHLNAVDLGFSPDGAVSVRVSLPDVRYPYDTGGEAIAEFYRNLDERLAEIPTVRAVGGTLSPPLAGVPIRTRPYAYRAGSQDVEWGSVSANYRTVTPGWFTAIGARLLSGRLIDGRDRWDRPVAVVVDAALAQKAWPGKEAVGQAIRVELFRKGRFGPHWGEVVGVVQSIRLDGLVAPEREQVYIAHHQSPQRTMYPTLRTSGDPLSVVELVQSAVHALEPGLPIFDVRLATSYVSSAMAQTRIAMIALAIFAAVAVALAGAGIFAAIAASVSQREREIGVRLALGASPASVFRWTVTQGVALAAIGVGVGLFGAALVTRFLSSVLVGVSPTDPMTMVSVATLVTLMASLACALPAGRAASVDPCESLRSQ
jgi:predicted permease